MSTLPPLHKLIPGTNFAVDAFQFRNPGLRYFLSHFHQDHWGGITKSWEYPIYCSKVTKRLLVHVLEVDPALLTVIPMDSPFDLGGGSTVTLMDANHCPGAAVLVFDVSTVDGPKRYVHCGDCRFDDRMKLWPAWRQPDAATMHPVEVLFLDTTYSEPKYRFPHQSIVIDSVISLVRDTLTADREATPPRRTLWVVATYKIGKERMLKAISDAAGGDAGLPIYADPEKIAILKLLDLDFIELFTGAPGNTPIHVVSWGQLGKMVPGGWKFLPDWSFVEQYLNWTNSLLPNDAPKFTDLAGIVPTGWTWEFQQHTSTLYHCSARPNQNHLKVFQIPYSEHSNYEELRNFVEYLRPGRVVPTVFGGPRTAHKIELRFRDLVDSKRGKQMGFKELFGAVIDAEASEQNQANVASLPEIPEDLMSTHKASVIVCPICEIHMPDCDINHHLDAGCLAKERSFIPGIDGLGTDKDRWPSEGGLATTLEPGPEHRSGGDGEPKNTVQQAGALFERESKAGRNDRTLTVELFTKKDPRATTAVKERWTAMHTIKESANLDPTSRMDVAGLSVKPMGSETASATLASEVDAAKVAQSSCPVCDATVCVSVINLHLDACLAGAGLTSLNGSPPAGGRSVKRKHSQQGLRSKSKQTKLPWAAQTKGS
ncbi:DNA cross-link repair 1A protein [Thoreauomyces humboldtii]|nr:DNA cross-link repair 1A protein [Thoreauomyces humboldtii]